MARYIDVDEFKKWLVEYSITDSEREESRQIGIWVDAFPVADVRENVHGEWINAYPDIEPNPMLMYGICSECGFKQSISDKLNFCPNCGADMREIKEHTMEKYMYGQDLGSPKDGSL